MSIDLRANPFCLSDAQIGWVQDTLASMSEDEKIGQLFLPIAFSSDENYLRYEMLRYCNNNETLDALVEKLMGRDTFRGKSPTDPFCGKEYLRY